MFTHVLDSMTSPRISHPDDTTARGSGRVLLELGCRALRRGGVCLFLCLARLLDAFGKMEKLPLNQEKQDLAACGKEIINKLTRHTFKV